MAPIMQEGVVTLVMPSTGLTLALMNGALLAPGVLDAPTTSRETSAGAKAPTKCYSQATSPSRPSSPSHPSSPFVSSPPPSQRLSINEDPAHSEYRSRGYLERCLVRNLDIRMIALKSYIDKIKSSYNCGASQCPSLQQRLSKHKRRHHSPNDSAGRQPTRLIKLTQDLNELATPNTGRKDATLPQNAPNGTDGGPPRVTMSEIGRIAISTSGRITQPDHNNKGSQAKLHQLNNFNQTQSHARNNQKYPINNQYSNTPPNNASYNNEFSNTQPSGSKFKNDQFIATDPENKTYSENYSDMDREPISLNDGNATYKERIDPLVEYKYGIQDEIKDWLLKVPFYPTDNPDDLRVQENAVNELIENISSLVPEIDTKDYESHVGREINKCLDSLNMWFPQDKRDHVKFKREIRDQLLDNILKINKMHRQMALYDTAIDTPNNTDTNVSLGSKLAKDGTSSKRTLRSNKICGCEASTNSPRCSKKIKCDKLCVTCCDGVENEISDWLNRVHLQKLDGTGPVSKRLVTDILMKRLAPYFDKTSSENSKATLKAEIIDVLHELSIGTSKEGNRKQYINKFADDLSNRLIGIHSRIEWSGKGRRKSWNNETNTFVVQSHSELFGPANVNVRAKVSEALKQEMFQEVKDCLASTSFKGNNSLGNDILNILLNQIDAICHGKGQEAKTEIASLLQSPEDLTLGLVEKILENILDLIVVANDSLKKEATQKEKPSYSGSLTGYTSERELFRYPVNENSSSGKEARYSIDNISDVIRSWLGKWSFKLKGFNKDFTEIMIYDLSYELVDKMNENRNEIEALEFYVKKWLDKFKVKVDKNDEFILENLIRRVKAIYCLSGEVYYENRPSFCIDLNNESANKLKKEICSWIQQYPAQMFKECDQIVQEAYAYDLAKKIYKRFSENHTYDEIEVEVAKWLLKVVKPKETNNIVKLTKTLTTKLMSHPNNLVIVASAEVTKKGSENDSKSKLSGSTTNRGTTSQSTNTNTDQVVPNVDLTHSTEKIMMQFIAKYIKLNHDVEDTTARAAFAHILKDELQKIISSTRKEIYDNFQDHFSLEHLDIELEFVKDISNWLKNIPIDRYYNTPDNTKRITLVLGLAKALSEAEIQRIFSKQTMDYNKYIGGIICRFISVLPILPDQKENVGLMTDQLVSKIASRRPFVEYTLRNKRFSNPPSTIEFIESYVLVNGQEVTNDDLKLEAWLSRIIKEIKKIIYKSHPEAFSKTQVYDRLANETIPREDKVKYFNLELDYAREITDWLKNIHLTHINQSDLVKSIVKLAENMTDFQAKGFNDPNKTQSQEEMQNYVKQWIDHLPLDQRHDVIKPIAMKQLIKRIETVNKNHEENSSERRQQIPKPVSPSPSSSKTRKPSPPKKSRSHPSQVSHPYSQKDLSSLLIEAVDKLCNSLSIENGSEKDVDVAKGQIARKLFQKIGDLNGDPQFSHDNLLYRDIISETLDQAIIDQHQSVKLQLTEAAKESFLNEIVEAKKVIKQVSADQNYLEKLEHTLDSALLNPIAGLKYQDPCFEIYKNRLASMFVLDNFDHGNEIMNSECEKIIKIDINKYFQNAQRRNALPLSKDELYDELYSTLYKVPIPDEHVLANEVEEIKTRCEVQAWYENLPLKPVQVMAELLERDQVITTLAKRLCQIQIQEDNSDAKTHKEIKKCLTMVPLLSVQEKNLDEFATNLQSRIKTRRNHRINSNDTNETNPRRNPNVGLETNTAFQSNNIKNNAISPSRGSKKSSSDKSSTENIPSEISNKSSKAPSTESAQSTTTGQTIVSPRNSNKIEENPSRVQSSSSQSNRTDNSSISQTQSRKNISSDAAVLNTNDNRPETNNRQRRYSMVSPGHILLNNIETLCNQIPFPINSTLEQQKAKEIKDDLVTLVLRKFDEVNGDPKIFNNDALYEYLLNIELDKILLTTLPQNLPVERNIIRNNLIIQIKSVKPFIKADKEVKEYKIDLKDVTTKIIGKPNQSKLNVIFEKARNDIIDYFLEYQFNRHNDDKKKFFKGKVFDTFKTYSAAIQDSKSEQETRLRTNQLICELAKIPPPHSDVLFNEIVEIRMKNQIGKLFEQLIRNPSLDKKIELDKTKTSLAKRLIKLEMAGYGTENEKLMEDEIIKTLKQLGVNTKQDKVNEFTKNLKETASERKAHAEGIRQLSGTKTLEYMTVPRTSPELADNHSLRPPVASGSGGGSGNPTSDSGIGSGNQVSPGCSDECSANANTSFYHGSHKQLRELRDAAINQSRFDPLLSSTMGPGKYELGPDDTPGNLPDTTTSSSRPGWQYASGFGPGGQVSPRSLPNTTGSRSVGQQMQPFEYTSNFGPGSSRTPGSLLTSTFGSNNSNLLNSTYNSMGQQAQPFEYASGFGPGGQFVGSLEDSSLSNARLTLQNPNQQFANDRSGITPFQPYPYNPPSADISSINNRSFNQQLPHNSFGGAPYPPYLYSPPPADLSAIKERRFSIVPKLIPQLQTSSSYLSLPPSFNESTFRHGGFNPPRQLPDSTLNYSNYNPVISSTFIPEQNLSRRHFGQGQLTSIASARSYEGTDPSLNVSSLPSNYNGPLRPVSPLQQNQPFQSKPGKCGVDCTSTSNRVETWNSLDSGAQPIMQKASAMIHQNQPSYSGPRSYEGTVPSMNISSLPSNYNAPIRPISPFQQSQPFQQRPGRSGVNFSSSLDRVDTWNTSDLGAQPVMQQASAMIHQNQLPIPLAPSYSGPLVLRDYRSTLTNPQYQGQEFAPGIISGGQLSNSGRFGGMAPSNSMLRSSGGVAGGLGPGSFVNISVPIGKSIGDTRTNTNWGYSNDSMSFSNTRTSRPHVGSERDGQYGSQLEDEWDRYGCLCRMSMWCPLHSPLMRPMRCPYFPR